MTRAGARSEKHVESDLLLDVTNADPVRAVLGVCTGPLASLDPSPLHEVERAYLATLTAPRRRQSYLLGRLAARRALGRLLGAEQVARLAMGRGVFGQPVLEHDGAGFGVSITHTGDVGAAVAYPLGFPMGIDVEGAQPERVGTMQTQFTTEELQTVAEMPEERRCVATTAIWTAKEALSKVMGCGMTGGFKILAVKDVSASAEGFSGYFETFYQYQFLSLPFPATHVMSLVLSRHARLALRPQELEDMVR